MNFQPPDPPEPADYGSRDFALRSQYSASSSASIASSRLPARSKSSPHCAQWSRFWLYSRCRFRRSVGSRNLGMGDDNGVKA